MRADLGWGMGDGAASISLSSPLRPLEVGEGRVIGSQRRPHKSPSPSQSPSPPFPGRRPPLRPRVAKMLGRQGVCSKKGEETSCGRPCNKSPRSPSKENDPDPKEAGKTTHAFCAQGNWSAESKDGLGFVQHLSSFTWCTRELMMRNRNVNKIDMLLGAGTQTCA